MLTPLKTLTLIHTCTNRIVEKSDALDVIDEFRMLNVLPFTLTKSIVPRGSIPMKELPQCRVNNIMFLAI